MSRTAAIQHALNQFESGAFFTTLSRRVGLRTESQESGNGAALRAYLTDEIAPEAARLGFTSRIVDNPVDGGGPFLLAPRHEDDALPTVLIYGHGDVVRGYDAQWRAPLSPWTLTADGDRWYGRGSADNKGQHSINLAALASVLDARGGRMGFNAKLLIEMGEETGSPGLDALCRQERDALAADVLIASDGPRIAAARPTVFLGSRGSINFKLSLRARDGAHHSGNWGGLLRNPAIVLAHALASLVDARGAIRVAGLRPPPIPAAVREALADLCVGGGPGDPALDAGWGEPGLTAPERVFGWNTVEILAFKAGNPEHPVNAIPPAAYAHCQLRFVVGTDWQALHAHLRTHLDAHGFADIEIDVERGAPATRVSPDDPWVRWAVASLARTTGKKPAILPNLGGTLPNEVFADTLGLPTLWVPHSYPACSQHAPDEHLLASVVSEGLQMMAGLFWDLGDDAPTVRRAAHAAAGATL
ncbi:TPA: M20 family metallopeptidase [Burkholderia cepacia ATCC 25416]|uniref:M20 family metallopeptidase n=1 Tax=Burkholderia cepacia TaxID=292 RepID=UPI001CF1AD0C|nr:M20 family metallopeptidase [Burkholderia cepacia]HDR9767036.1 M20 family metallopeptidase [Burkholderia cepacia ATCC 25416]MCA8080896.1 M20 family metallopeptidase [Burkholderia cepacia]HDR9774141.1 M20 family metallopeptidase [Burkholderia cepacia ATCC 25416]HDR9783099.1 M20 family metallopeptidase [Burkholderia cepacia ATCC 25416]HDR9790368.1 M20 family metallopeptidase [Burkholderia cepacia ATCC 25416]